MPAASHRETRAHALSSRAPERVANAQEGPACGPAPRVSAPQHPSRLPAAPSWLGPNFSEAGGPLSSPVQEEHNPRSSAESG